MVMSPGTDRYRLFFALWPDESLREQIEERTQVAALASGGRRIAPCNYHITLLFLGNVGRAELEQAQESAAALATPAFDLSLDRIESPRRAAVMWLGSERRPPGLLALVQALRASTIAPRPDQAFRAHVTLVRDPAQRLPTARIEPVPWQAREFVLASSIVGAAGSQYTVIGRWPLRSVG